MAHDLGLKLTNVVDEFASLDLLIPKHQSGPRFLTQQTNSMFILTVHLKGYKIMNIHVGINEERSIITISGEKPVEEMLTVGGKLIQKDIKMRGFQKSFKIPQGVVLDKVKARFNEDDAKLIIQMPKSVKGLIAVEIEELKEEIWREPTKSLQVHANDESSKHEYQEIGDDYVQDLKENAKDIELREHKPPMEFSQHKQDEEAKKLEHVRTAETDSKENDIQEPKSSLRRFKICTPIIVGSSLFVSLIVLVFHLIQSEKQPKRTNKQDQA